MTDEPAGLNSIRQAAEAGIDRAKEIMAYVWDLRQQLGVARAQVERQRETVEKAKRDSALALQERATASNVRHNADLDRIAAHRDRADAEALLLDCARYVPVNDRRLLDAIDAYVERRDLRPPKEC